jgi:hypothetical protein
LSIVYTQEDGNIMIAGKKVCLAQGIRKVGKPRGSYNLRVVRLLLGR